MATEAEDHRYNNDLLLHPGELDRAQEAFPSVAHVLDFPALRDEFRGLTSLPMPQSSGAE